MDTEFSVNLPFQTTIFPETGSLPKGKYDFGFLQLKYLVKFSSSFFLGTYI